MFKFVAFRVLPVVVLALYAFIIPFHLYSADHYFDSKSETAAHADSNHHEHNHQSKHQPHHQPHNAVDHHFTSTLQRQLPSLLPNISAYALFPAALVISSAPQLPLAVSKLIPLSKGEPPNLQESRAPPSA